MRRVRNQHGTPENGPCKVFDPLDTDFHLCWGEVQRQNLAIPEGPHIQPVGNWDP